MVMEQMLTRDGAVDISLQQSTEFFGAVEVWSKYVGSVINVKLFTIFPDGSIAVRASEGNFYRRDEAGFPVVNKL